MFSLDNLISRLGTPGSTSLDSGEQHTCKYALIQQICKSMHLPESFVNRKEEHTGRRIESGCRMDVKLDDTLVENGPNGPAGKVSSHRNPRVAPLRAALARNG